MDSNFDIEDFKKMAKQMFEESTWAFWKADRSTLAQNLDTNVFGGFSDAIRHREELGLVAKLQSLEGVIANISDISVQPGAIAITVRLAAKQTWWVEAKDGGLIEGDRNTADEVVNTWTFRKLLNTPGAKWRVTGTQ